MTGKVEDFSTDPVPVASGAVAVTASQANVTKVYDPNPERETIRGQIAMQLLWLMGAILLTIILLLVFKVIAGIDDALKLVGAFLTPIVGLFGAVMGFYFGEKSGSGSNAAPPTTAKPPPPNPGPGSARP